jgi:multiple sugar transport system substrate-binding protein
VKKRNLLKLMAAGLLVFSGILTGCSGQQDQASGTTVLKVWAMGEEGKLLPQMTKKFEEQNPGVKVEVQAIPWEVAHNKVLTAVASKNGPDVLQAGTTWVPELAASGTLLDMKQYFDKYPELKPENYYEGSVETVKYGDQIVGVPWYVDTRVLYYRTDLLKEVGYEQPPKTWNELKDAASKLAKRGKGKYGIDLSPKDALPVFMFTWQSGGEILDENGNPKFNSKEFVDAVKFYNSFFTDGQAPAVADQSLDLFQSFKQGIKPMFISGPWMVNLLNKQLPDLKGKWATAVLPANKTNTSFVGGSNLSIFNFSKNKDAAVKFVAFMSNPKNQLEWFKISNDLPAHKQAWTDTQLQGDPILAAFGEQLKNAKSTPLIKSWAAVEKATSEALEKIIVGKQDIPSTLNKLNEDVKKMMKK